MAGKHTATSVAAVVVAVFAWSSPASEAGSRLRSHDGADAGTGSSSAARGDFDDDGRDDLIVAVPYEDNTTGAIHVFPGTTTGITGMNDRLIRPSHIPLGSDFENDLFGHSVAAGDFDGDGSDDLAVGAPWVDLIDQREGVVYVIPGGPGGLDPASAIRFSEQDIPAADGPETSDAFGWVLAAGNLGRGPADDLAIGSIAEDVGAVENEAGAVTVVYGSPTGLDPSQAQVWSQASPGIPESPEVFDSFGFSLAIADFGRTAQSDLAIGVPGESLDGRGEVGAVHLLYGSAAGVTATGAQFWHQGVRDVNNRLGTGNMFGFSLAAGNAGRSPQADLAIGVPRERIADVRGGAVAVLYGSDVGLTAAGDQLLSQNSAGMADGSEFLDDFGWTIAIGNLGRGAIGDLAIAAPSEEFHGVHEPGVVHVVYGSPSGLDPRGSQLFSQATPGIEDTLGFTDHFGLTLAIGDLGRAAVGDLVIGVPEEDLGPDASAGAIHVLFGTTAGITTTGAQFVHQDTTGIAEVADGGERFGGALG